ncbi:MAG: hypothetical protein EXQ92_00425 [Alphaproteobacteria bacterium]|nr:hypothetical protein [Alphaproteobacteria bacterium]
MALAPRSNSRRRLNELVQEQRGAVSDPGLAQVLDEIELRARVELAKLNQQA